VRTRATAAARGDEELLKKLTSLFGLGKGSPSPTIISTPPPGEGDAAIREALAREGDDGTAARHAIFYFYGGDLAGLEEAALAQNFFTHPAKRKDGLILEKTIAVDAASLAPIEEQMEAWSAAFATEYDGWECAVVGK
jgi:Regulator of ribonuclease activity B